MTGSLPHLAYLVEPRFRGGTSSALAAELPVTASLARLSVHALSGSLVQGDVHSGLSRRMASMGLRLDWDSPVIGADVVVIQNPMFLRRYAALPLRIVARRLIVVTHENPVRPDGAASYDLRAALSLIDRAAVVVERLVAPVSAHNRASVARAGALPPGWAMAPEDWTNIADMPMSPPTLHPRDRRGRLSREGLEKFPALADLDLSFPARAEANVLMGADRLGPEERSRRHWRLLPFGALPVEAFFGLIDFMVYHTAPTWTESFGRVIAEAIAAGKAVIAGPEAAEVFGDAVIVARPAEVDRVIAAHVGDPRLYAAQVERAQRLLAEGFGPDAFRRRASRLIGLPPDEAPSAPAPAGLIGAAA